MDTILMSEIKRTKNPVYNLYWKSFYLSKNLKQFKLNPGNAKSIDINMFSVEINSLICYNKIKLIR